MTPDYTNRIAIGALILCLALSRAGISAADHSDLAAHDSKSTIYEQVQLSLQAKVDARFRQLIAQSESKVEDEWDSLFGVYPGLSIESLEDLQRLLRDRNTIQNANRS